MSNVCNSELTGYTLSAQGLYLHSTRNGGWAPQLLSADEAQAGVYLFEETETDIYKIKSNLNDIQYINDWGPIFGNDKSNKPNLSTFTLTQVTEYTLTVPANGVTTLCLPFNVVLPAGVTAYDLAKANIIKGEHYNKYELVEVAGENETLAKNTPVIIKAAANDYTLTITMDGEGAKASVENSVLRSGLVKTTVAAGNNYTFDGVDFNLVATDTEVAANQCWMECDIPEASTLTLCFATATDIQSLPATTQAQQVYNIAGQRLAHPQSGINLIEGRKFVIK